mmetsp:Transcript_10836/g.33227  ORF Transcript_10836/g.33227 Transcript_10836/m.33227 type:complete len:409 (+) Transcript_10836:375-1601(+)
MAQVFAAVVVAAVAVTLATANVNRTRANDAALEVIVAPGGRRMRSSRALNYDFEDDCLLNPDGACLEKCFQAYSTDVGPIGNKGYFRCCREVFPDDPSKCCGVNAEFDRVAPKICDNCHAGFTDDCGNSCSYWLRIYEPWSSCYDSQIRCEANHGCCKQYADPSMCYCFFEKLYPELGEWAQHGRPAQEDAVDCCLATFEDPSECCNNSHRGVFDECCETTASGQKKWRCERRRATEVPAPTAGPEESWQELEPSASEEPEETVEGMPGPFTEIIGPPPAPEKTQPPAVPPPECDECSFVKDGLCVSSCQPGFSCGIKRGRAMCVDCSCFHDQDGESCCVLGSPGKCKPRIEPTDRKCRKSRIRLARGGIPQALEGNICWTESNLVNNGCGCEVQTASDGSKTCALQL